MNHQCRARCTRCLLYLVNIHDILPSSLSSMNVVKEGNHAIFAGGFSASLNTSLVHLSTNYSMSKDIWRGRTMDDKSQVCLKVLQISVNNGVQNVVKIISRFLREALVWRNAMHTSVLPFPGANKELFAPSFLLDIALDGQGSIMSFLRHDPRLDRLKSVRFFPGSTTITCNKHLTSTTE
ncbi:hypothetical protein ARMGADRAFT_1098254 [Armillaria gallica]|uniref:Uncharacterized protein n=1 Tax=Armillaria gallica TaxID=47427 RepID=A0A2H3CGN8_ARMGA|nr:hypothetical protein ARMGADRAFT_1098254 [Armillaria gallica]